MITEKLRIIKYTTILGKKLTKQNYQNFFAENKNITKLYMILSSGREELIFSKRSTRTKIGGTDRLSTTTPTTPATSYGQTPRDSGLETPGSQNVTTGQLRSTHRDKMPPDTQLPYFELSRRRYCRLTNYTSGLTIYRKHKIPVFREPLTSTSSNNSGFFPHDNR